MKTHVSRFLSVMQARFWSALWIYALTVGTTVVVALWLPNRYATTATIVADQNRPEPASESVYDGTDPTAFMATQVDILKSNRVALRVIKQLRLTEDAATRAQWMRATEGVGSFELWLAEGLQFRVDVKASHESNVITVGYEAGDPVGAAKMTNAFVQAYLDTLLELKADPARQYARSFDARSEQLRADLERAQARLTAYQRETGVIVASDGEFDAETTRLNKLSTQLVELQAVAAQANSKRLLAGAGAGLDEVVNHPALVDLRDDVVRAEANLSELSSRLGENHPQVRDAKANVAALRAQLDSETRRVTATVDVESSIDRQREVELRAALEAQRARVMRMQAARAEGAVLVRDVQAARRAYDAVHAKLNRSGLENLAMQSNAYVLAWAVPPSAPSSPNLLRSATLGVVAGLLLAVATAMLLEYGDGRVRSVKELSARLEIPLLGVLPARGGKGRFASREKPLVTPRTWLGRLFPPRRPVR
jgi:chain length determinant protein EpsF